MPSKSKKNDVHVTRGSVLDDLGFSRSEALETKIKADLWRSLVDYITPLQLSQRELGRRLKIHQPDVSNLLRGKISRFSTDALIHYAALLHFEVEVSLKAPRVRKTVKPKLAAGTVKRLESAEAVPCV